MNFVDTNILVYAVERFGENPLKHRRSQDVLRGEKLCLSIQVLGEFYNAVTSKRREIPLAHEEAVAWIQIWKRFRVVSIEIDRVDLALELCKRFQISYYDALIVSAARYSNSEKIYTEDLNHGQDYGGIQAFNPFL